MFTGSKECSKVAHFFRSIALENISAILGLIGSHPDYFSYFKFPLTF